MGALRRLARHSIGRHKNARVEQIPFGCTVKMSDALVEIARPMTDRAQDEKQYRLAISMAALCWNLSLMPTDERSARAKEALRDLVKPGQRMDDVQECVNLLVARKEALFPYDKRVITTYRVSCERGNVNIVVEYSPPDEK